MNRANLERLASFDGVVRVDASDLKELLGEVKGLKTDRDSYKGANTHLHEKLKEAEEKLLFRDAAIESLESELASYEAGPSQAEVDAALANVMSFPSERANWSDLFAGLDTLGTDYAEWKVSDRHNEDNILGLLVVARGERALELRKVLEQLDAEEAAGLRPNRRARGWTWMSLRGCTGTLRRRLGRC